MCVSVYVCLGMYMLVCMCLPAYWWMGVNVCLCMHVPLCVCLCIVYVCVCVPVCLPMFVSVLVCECLFMYVCVYLCVAVCLPVCEYVGVRERMYLLKHAYFCRNIIDKKRNALSESSCCVTYDKYNRIPMTEAVNLAKNEIQLMLWLQTISRISISQSLI